MHFNTYLTAAFTGASLLTTTVLATSKPKNSYARNLKTISLIYKFTVFPNNVSIISGGSAAVPKGLFSG
ncbi:uncharacterized protein RSE6_14466 [Rhynchosporium secalis]|uniref:Uncharacterized protein n=1 Tax=Rhynchosporium secalis TaxID=38038 RepID=A0A1E1MVC2_RHYSE|nr:uncharacterized protein RSE6_14466 [Rhynchosporium secalis]